MRLFLTWLLVQLETRVNPLMKPASFYPLQSMWDYIKTVHHDSHNFVFYLVRPSPCVMPWSQHLKSVSGWIHDLCILASHISEWYLSRGTEFRALDDMLRQVSSFREPPLPYLERVNRNKSDLKSVTRRVYAKVHLPCLQPTL